MKIYFIRHGETIWNTVKRFQGSSNSPLTELGRNQALKLGKRLKNTNFTNFYSSPLGRTIETSQLILKDRNIKIDTIDEFKEISVGDMEGMDREFFASRFPTELYNLFNNPKEYDPSKIHGESYFELIKRVENGLNKIISSHKKDDTVAIVTHGVTLKAILKIIKNLSFEEIIDVEIPKNTSLTIVDYNYDNKKYSIDIFSDTAHLDDEGDK